MSSPPSSPGWTVPCPASLCPPWSCSLGLAGMGTSPLGFAHGTSCEVRSWDQHAWYLLDREREGSCLLPLPGLGELHREPRGRRAAGLQGWGQARLGPPGACPCVLINHRVNQCLPWVLLALPRGEHREGAAGAGGLCAAPAERLQPRAALGRWRGWCPGCCVGVGKGALDPAWGGLVSLSGASRGECDGPAWAAAAVSPALRLWRQVQHPATCRCPLPSCQLSCLLSAAEHPLPALRAALSPVRLGGACGGCGAGASVPPRPGGSGAGPGVQTERGCRGQARQRGP